MREHFSAVQYAFDLCGGASSGSVSSARRRVNRRRRAEELRRIEIQSL